MIKLASSGCQDIRLKHENSKTRKLHYCGYDTQRFQPSQYKGGHETTKHHTKPNQTKVERQILPRAKKPRLRFIFSAIRVMLARVQGLSPTEHAGRGEPSTHSTSRGKRCSPSLKVTKILIPPCDGVCSCNTHHSRHTQHTPLLRQTVTVVEHASNVFRPHKHLAFYPPTRCLNTSRHAISCPPPPPIQNACCFAVAVVYVTLLQDLIGRQISYHFIT